MTTHYLKTWPEYFNATLQGLKPFEVRNNDRGFEMGDVLVLKEWDPKTEEYTSRELIVRVSYVLKDYEFVAKGYVVMGILLINYKPGDSKDVE